MSVYILILFSSFMLWVALNRKTVFKPTGSIKGGEFPLWTCFPVAMPGLFSASVCWAAATHPRATCPRRRWSRTNSPPTTWTAPSTHSCSRFQTGDPTAAATFKVRGGPLPGDVPKKGLFIFFPLPWWRANLLWTPALRIPASFRPWTSANQSAGMCSDSESAGGSSESRSMDSPTASPGETWQEAVIYPLNMFNPP